MILAKNYFCGKTRKGHSNQDGADACDYLRHASRNYLFVKKFEMLTVVTINYNTAKFIELLLYSLTKLTFHEYKVIIADNNSKSRDFCYLQKIVDRYSNVRLYRKQGFDLKGSLAHGTTLNELIPQIDTEYGVIVDADFVFLKKNWDKILIEKMKNDNGQIVGVKPPVWWGKPIDFPAMFLLLFKSIVIKKMNIDFRPFRPRDIKISDAITYSLKSSFKEEIDNFDYIIKKPINSFVFVDDILRDTGWHLRKKFKECNFFASLINSFSTDVYKDEKEFCNLKRVDLFYNDNELLASHFGQGARLGLPAKFGLIKNNGSSIKIIYLLLFIIRKLILIRLDKRERDRWLMICKNKIEFI